MLERRHEYHRQACSYNRRLRAGAQQGILREPVADVADATIAAIEKEDMQVVRGGEARAAMIALNRGDPSAVDRRFAELKPSLEEAVRDHTAL